MKIKIVAVLLLVSLATGCNFNPTSPTLPTNLPDIYQNIPFLRAAGGDCLQAAAAMAVCYLVRWVPTAEMIKEQNDWLDDYRAAGKPIYPNETVALVHGYWRDVKGCPVKAVRAVPDWNRIYHEMDLDHVVILDIEGWQRKYLHSIVLTAILPGKRKVHVHDPGETLPDLEYTFEQIEEWRKDAGGQSIIISLE